MSNESSGSTPPPGSVLADLLVVVTGMSGAGKSTALHALEDLSFFCVDNLPTPLMGQTLSLCKSAGLRRVAFGIDVRVGDFLRDRAALLDVLQGRTDRDVHVLFLDANDEALLRRYSETRRPHPLSTMEGQSSGSALAALDGIRIERERLGFLRANATRVVDTTTTSVHDLRKLVVQMFGPASGQTPRTVTRFMSFGFKYGMPVDADVVLDVRFLPNPYFVRHLRDLPGTNPAVSTYVLNHEETAEFVRRTRDLLEFTVPRYEREGKAYLTVAIGCTGGRHRSVAIAERLAADLRERDGREITVVHRDVDRIRIADRLSDTDLIGGGPRGKGASLQDGRRRRIGVFRDHQRTWVARSRSYQTGPACTEIPLRYFDFKWRSKSKRQECDGHVSYMRYPRFSCHPSRKGAPC